MSAEESAPRDDAAVDVLLRYYRPRTGRWITPTGEGWQPALALEAILNTYQRTGRAELLSVLDTSFRRYRGRRSRFYDDDGWYLNVWLRAYELTGADRYLAEARALFDGLTGAWDDTCGGGVWWTHDRTYKNAITNELFLLAAIRLHRLAGGDGYLDWARREWHWFDGTGMINLAGLVNDGLSGECVNNGQTTWTYNQGVILSALVELWHVTRDSVLLDRARHIADAATARLVNRAGVLTEPGEPDRCDGNQLIFKGIFAQGLARLYQADRAAHGAYLRFLTHNADRLWHTGRDRLGRLGLTWSTRSVRYNAATHISGTLLLGSVALCSRDGTE